MKKKLLQSLFCLTLFFTFKNVYAFDVNNYAYRDLCEVFEVAGFHADGYIDRVACFNNFQDAQTFMRQNGADDLAIMTHDRDGKVKIVDANMALLDLSVNPEQLTYFYENSELTSRQYTYMDTGSLYGGVDGGLLDVSYSGAKSQWTAKVRTGNFTGWIGEASYEIVPITWLRSYSFYTVTSDSIRHNYVTKIQNDYRSSGGSTIGPKPDMLSEGTYYSFDGHYFYQNIRDLIIDYKNQTYDKAINKNNPYYNYYMYLSNHTRTVYSSVNIDEYIRNNLNYKYDIYGDDISDNASRLYGSGTFFYYAQEKYGVNAILSLSLSRNETGNGRSYLAIIKNNGFGLNAVDSNPINGANWYATFGSSILGYASKWVTYGFAHPRDWRYFGPQFGDKWIGMNVKYASDTYWSEKMASNYYFLDKAFGLQDYNYYQLGVVKYTTNAYSDASTSSRFIYEYPEAEDAVVIIGEEIRNNEKWYKVVSDLNIDDNYNEITSGNYNWNKYVYVKADAVKLINQGKNGYISPNDVTEYQNKYYEYDLFVENGEFKPRVGISTKDTSYYYDSSLTSPTGQTLLKDRYVMIYAQANLHNNPVAYLVSNNYFKSQREWVSADSIKQTNTPYGKVTVKTDNNQYTWVNYNTEDAAYSKISGLYTNSYVPIIDSVKVGNDTWYKVPVNLSGNDNVYGYTLAKFSDYIWIDVSTPIAVNIAPIITANDQKIYDGQTFDVLKDVSASDAEDGDLTSIIEVTSNDVNTSVPGTYHVTYQVKDNNGNTTTKTITITVLENKAPVIEANDKILTINTTFNALESVTAKDNEDGDLTSKITVSKNTVNMKKIGTYKVIYKVTDSMNKTTTKEIKVEVVKNQSPQIITSNKQVLIDDDTWNPLEGVTAKDPEDGDITNNLKVIKNNVKIDTPGDYEVTYEVIDSSDNKVQKTITVTVLDYQEEDGEFYLESLEWNTNKKQFEMSGYLIIYNHDNVDKTYSLILVDKNDESKVYPIEMNAWTEKTPYNLGKIDGHDYSNSWFKGFINLKDIPNGDYALYMMAYSNQYVTRQLVDNFFNQPITKRANDDNHGYHFKVLTDLSTLQMDLEVRDKVYTTSQAPTFRTMINEFEELKFQNDKLYIQGYSYNYKGTYSKEKDITRTIILENTSTYKQTVFDVGATTGPYELKTSDKESKAYAWYEQELDLSSLEKGTYSVSVYTKTSNAEDFGELTDMFRMANGTMTVNDKKYTITYNPKRLNRIEIIVE